MILETPFDRYFATHKTMILLTFSRLDRRTRR